jgi:methylmalonyl-CoA mutase, C-terminal domain
MNDAKIRVLLAKPGLDGHDRGIKVVARGLRDAGMEVIYLGLRLSPEQIAEAAIQEAVDVVGIDCLSGAHMPLFTKTVSEIRERGGEDILVIGGGIIPQKDVQPLKEAGIAGVFGPGTTIEEIVEFIETSLKGRESAN